MYTIFALSHHVRLCVIYNVYDIGIFCLQRLHRIMHTRRIRRIAHSLNYYFHRYVYNPSNTPTSRLPPPRLIVKLTTLINDQHLIVSSKRCSAAHEAYIFIIHLVEKIRKMFVYRALPA